MVGEESGHSIEGSDGSVPVILVVDDEPDISLALGDLLGNLGFRVEAVETGNEALRRVSSAHPYRAVILDLGLPDIDGLAVLQGLHAQDESLPVIILTAHGDQREKIIALQYHAFAHLVKPYDRREIVEIIQRAVKMKNLTIQAEQVQQALTSSESLREAEQRRSQQLLSDTEQRLRLALKAGNMGIWDWDVPLNRVIWSEEVSGLFGRAGEPVPTSFQEFLPWIHLDDQPLVKEAVRAALEDNVPYEIDHRILWPSGEIRWLSCKGQVIRDQSGQPVRMLGTIQDITGRKEQDLRLRESESRFREVMEAIREVFWVSNPQKTSILYISPGYETIWGRPCADLYRSAQSWMEAIHPDDRDRVRVHALTQQTVGRYQEEYRIQRPDGSIRWVRDRAFPVRDHGGEVFRIVGVAEDITEQKQVQQGLQALAEAAWDLTGPPLYRTLIWETAAILNVKFAFIVEHLPDKPGYARMQAMWDGESFLDPVDYPLAGTPCEEAEKGLRCFWPDKVRDRFPADPLLADWDVESYFAHPIRGVDGRVMGHVGVMDRRPMVKDSFWGGILEFVAMRVALEWYRLRSNASSTFGKVS
jgi:PAS domain S-box-containing protein